MSAHANVREPNDATAPRHLLKIDGVAQFLDVTRRTVYELPIPYTVVGARRRYRPEDVEAYLEARREEPAP